MGTTVPLQIKQTSQRPMVLTRNTSRSNANHPRMQDQLGDMDNRPLGVALETVRANTDEVGTLRVTNQHLLKELEQLTRQIRRPQETRQARQTQNPITEGEQHLDPRREADREGETSNTREHDPHQPPGEDRNEERSCEQRFRDIQQEISHMKVAVKGRTPVSMDALVQQTESPFTIGVLHFLLPTKFIMLQIETFDGTKDPIDCDAPKPGCPLTTRQPAENLYVSYYETHTSKMASWAHTPILIKHIPNYIPIVHEL